jgi:hypothetical protein
MMRNRFSSKQKMTARVPNPVKAQRFPDGVQSLRADFFHAGMFTFRAGKTVAPGE